MGMVRNNYRLVDNSIRRAIGSELLEELIWEKPNINAFVGRA